MTTTAPSLDNLLAEAPSHEAAVAATPAPDVVVVGRLRAASHGRFVLAIGPDAAGLSLEGARDAVRGSAVLHAPDDPVRRVVAVRLRGDAVVSISQRTVASAAARHLALTLRAPAARPSHGPGGALPFVLARPHAVREIAIPGGVIPVADVERDPRSIPPLLADRVTLGLGEPPPKLDVDDPPPATTPPEPPQRYTLCDPLENITIAELPPTLFPLAPLPPEPPPPEPPRRSSWEEFFKAVRDLTPHPPHDPPWPPPVNPDPPDLPVPDWLEPFVEHGTWLWIGADWKIRLP